MHANFFEFYLEFLWSKNYEILWVFYYCLLEALVKILELMHVLFLRVSMTYGRVHEMHSSWN